MNVPVRGAVTFTLNDCTALCKQDKPSASLSHGRWAFTLSKTANEALIIASQPPWHSIDIFLRSLPEMFSGSGNYGSPQIYPSVDRQAEPSSTKGPRKRPAVTKNPSKSQKLPPSRPAAQYIPLPLGITETYQVKFMSFAKKNDY